MERWQEIQPALGSQAVITLVAAAGTDTVPIFQELWDQVTSFEQRFSRFLPTSELTTLNQSAGQKVVVGPQMRALLAVCQKLARQTDGLFNPFILPALQQAGYAGSWPTPGQVLPELDYHDRQPATIDQLELGKTWAKIPANSALDFGGIGKGYLLDQLGDYLQQQGITNYWLSLGGDILCCGYDLDHKPWSVGIQHATKTTQTIAEISNHDGQTLAIATSGVTKRQGKHQNQSWHHIINPSTGKSAKTDILTATVTAPQATQADVLAKCLVIAGSKQAISYINKDQTMYLQLIDGTIIS